MGIIIDVVIIAILILSICLGYKKGLVNVIFNIFAFIVAIVATLILYKPISNIVINNTQIDENIRNAIIEKYGVEDVEENEKKSTGLSAFIEGTIEEATNETKEETVENLANEISVKAIQVVTGIILFVIIRIVLIFLKFLTESLASHPIIRQFNGVGGALYGALRAVVIVYILVNVLYLALSVNQNGKIQEAVDNSYITKYLYEHNLIINTIDF